MMSHDIPPARFIEHSWLSISVPNAIMVGALIVLFILALVLPFPGGEGSGEQR